MNNIIEIKEAKEKQSICDNILHDLPNWFETKSGLKEYHDGVVDKTFLAYYQDNEPAGFYALNFEKEKVCNLYVLGVKKAYHQQGIGTKLYRYIESYIKNKDIKYITVYTLSGKAEDPFYEKTRNFYKKLGFDEIYETDKIWGKNNPFVLMIKTL